MTVLLVTLSLRRLAANDERAVDEFIVPTHGRLEEQVDLASGVE
jgi:hypothetical protein